MSRDHQNDVSSKGTIKSCFLRKQFLTIWKGFISPVPLRVWSPNSARILVSGVCGYTVRTDYSSNRIVDLKTGLAWCLGLQLRSPSMKCDTCDKKQNKTMQKKTKCALIIVLIGFWVMIVFVWPIAISTEGLDTMQVQFLNLRSCYLRGSF